MVDTKKKMKENILWIIVAIIIGYIFLTSGSSVAEQIKFLILNNLLFILIATIIGAIFYQKWQK